jgi:hypothetical protein
VWEKVRLFNVKEKKKTTRLRKPCFIFIEKAKISVQRAKLPASFQVLKRKEGDPKSSSFQIVVFDACPWNECRW